MEVEGGDPGELDVGDEPWELQTAELVVDYARLQVELRGETVPAIPVSYGESLVLALPAEGAPWLEPFLHPLADPETGAEAEMRVARTLCYNGLAA